MSLAQFQKRMAAEVGRIYWQPAHYQTIAKHYGVSEEQVAKAITPNPVIASFPETITKKSASDDVQRSFRWVMNDGEIDRAGDIVVAAGVDTTHFRSNPIALFQHDANRPIGTWTHVHAEGEKLRGTLNLATELPLAEYARKAIAAGVIKAASIGFRPEEFEPIKNGGFRFTKIELMETSLVSLPASRGSLRERELSPEERKVERLADLAAIQAKGRELDARIAKMPAPEEPLPVLAQIKARRAERQRIAAMGPKQHADYLNDKARQREELQQRLRDLRGQS